ncbi:uncharacterized protein LOC128384037 [Scomber japonicus]|uniref:uncharacterized protein LOC128384037 n=1 Tax=Scomber japonicus TaxID=13676 RepID=UPI00230623F1|nr:uncharacterized protein LOC128384037 [Scomber japonicus]
MMTSPVFVLYLTCMFVGKMAQTTSLKSSSSVYQDSGFISANISDNVTLHCFYKGDFSVRFHWYKQTLGQRPRLISTSYEYEIKYTLHNEFKNSSRFTLDKNHLTITHLQISDSATYYCAVGNSVILEFAKGAIISVKRPVLVHQSASESIQPGGSVTLNCTVHTGTCDDGEHSVYWFKYSEESHPGLIYTHGGRNDQCERNTSTQTHTCVYNLPMKSLNLSHAGTYYCAVASCGQILFGDGTKLDVGNEVDCFVLVYFLSGALAFTILSVLLSFSMYKMNKSNSDQSYQGYKDRDTLYYCASSKNLTNRQKDQIWSECVYYSVKQ